MQAHMATLCEHATVRDDGRIDVAGAAPEVVTVARLPWSGTLRFALVLQFEAVDDPGDMRVGVVVVRGRDSAVVGQVDAGELQHHRTVRHVPGSPPYIPFALDISVEFTEEGQYGVVVRNRDSQRLAFVVFVVRVVGSAG